MTQNLEELMRTVHSDPVLERDVRGAIDEADLRSIFERSGLEYSEQAIQEFLRRRVADDASPARRDVGGSREAGR